MARPPLPAARRHRRRAPNHRRDDAQYADNILKNYATAVSILLTVAATSVVTRVPPSPAFVVGTAAVLVSIFLYSSKAKAAAPAPAAAPLAAQ